MNLPILTPDQLDKLNKLETELALKKKRDEETKERRLADSKRTGIPYDIIDIDVVKLGSMLGLFKNKQSRESNQIDENFSMIDLLLGGGLGACNKPTYDYSKIPPYFTCANDKIQEDCKLSYQSDYVNMQCSKYSKFISGFLKHIYDKVERVISLSIQHLSIGSFIEGVKETSDVVLDMILETDDSVELIELYNQLKILRNSLISVIPICEYKELLTKQVLTLVQKKCENISNYLSYIDATLSLYPICDTIEPHDIISIRRSLIVRTYNKDPKLVPLNITVIAKECCTPSVMYVHLAEILNQSVIGPYFNNPIGFLKSAASYYVLKHISEDGIRLWIHDDELYVFSNMLRTIMISYVTKTFKIIRKYVKGKNHPIILQLEDTLSALNKPDLFRKMICSIVATGSPIIPSDADVFDYIPKAQVPL